MKFFVNRTARLSTYALLGVCTGITSFAPSFVEAQPAPAAPPSTPVSLDFPLGPGDQVNIVVANHPELSGASIPVSETGQIAVPVIGNVTVSGKSLTQVQEILAARFRKEVRNPVVAVTVSAAAARSVSVLGPVANPGKVNLQPGWHVYDALVAAGGLLRPGDEIVGTLQRGKTQIPLEIAKLNSNPAVPANLPLQRGDVLNLSLAPGTIVTVMGEVKTPGTMTLRRSWRLLDALMGAGGLNQTPDLTRVSVSRGGKTNVVDLSAAFADRNSPANMDLMNGDVVDVKAVKTTFAVASLHNLVHTPNAFTLDGDVTVTRAILAAGSLTVPPSDVVATIRRGSKIIPVDLQKASYDPNYDLLLQDGDVLNVNPPEGPAITVSGSVNKPGPLYLKKDSTVLDAVVAAGGLVGKPEDSQISVLRNSRQGSVVLQIDPVRLITLKDLGQNLRLSDGDTVLVNAVKNTTTVFISGEVTTPGSYELKDFEGLKELLLHAGGPTAFAALRQVRIARHDGSSYVIDLSTALLPDAPAIPFTLLEGDYVTVPKNTNQILVLEAVNKPGYWPVPETGKMTVLDALLAAGGTKSSAKTSEIALVRPLGNGTANVTTIPMNQISKGNLVMNTPVQAGDIIVVPEKGRARSIGPLLSGLGIARAFFN